MCESNSLNNGTTDFQDLLICESSIDDILTSINNKISTSQSSSTNLSEFKPQIEEMPFNNNTLNSSPPQSGDLSLNEFQYPVPSSDMLSPGSPESFLDLSDSTSLDNICPESLQYSLTSKQNSTEDIFSQKPFLYTQNSTNIGDFNPSEPLYYSPNLSESSIEEIYSPDILSPLTYNNFKDLSVSPINFALADIGSNSSMKDIFDTSDNLLTSESNLDPSPPVILSENGKKRTSIKYESSSDESLKKKRKTTNETVKNYKSTKKVKSQKSNEGSNKRLNVSGIDADTIKTILASLFNAKNRNVEFKSVQGNHSDDDDENMTCDENENENMSCDEATSSDTKLQTPRSKSSTSPSQQQPNSETLTNKQKKKVAHNVIERRYRNNINDRINELKNVVPALCHLKSKDDDAIEEVDGIPAATKTNKATILKKATEYIVYLKRNNRKINNENDILKKIVETIPGGAELYNSYLTNENELTPPRTPPSEIDRSSYRNEFPPSGNGGSRILMSLFMCMTFLTDPSEYVHSVSHHHHDEGRVITGNDSIEPTVQNKIYNSQNNMTIDIWYFARVFIFLICFTYVIWPSFFSIKSQRIRKSTIISCLNSKTKDSTELYSSLSNTSSMNTLEYAVGLFLESLRLFIRRFFGYEISCGSVDVDMDERLLEIELWNRLGEAELCGGNKRATRLSVLYTCFKTINLLENPYIYHRCMRTSPSRIYANAALQCHVGLRSIPILSHKAVSYFWNLAIRGKSFSNLEEKWLEIALINDKDNKILEFVTNRINYHVFHLSKNEETPKSIINTTVPLIYVSEVQALFHIKDAFSNLISVRHNVNKVQKKSKFTFSELLSITTPTSLMHWYALVGCIVQAFYDGNNDLGVKLINKLKEESKTNNDLSKQIITLSLLSRSLLIFGKVEASIHYADKVANYVSLKKNQKTENVEIDKDLVIREIVNDIEKLAEFCVGWVVLETRIVALGVIGNLLSKNKGKALPNVLDDKYITTSIDIWTRYLRRSSKFDVFDRIPKIREKLIRKLDIVGRIVSGLDEEIDSRCDRDDYDKQDNSEYIATRALRVLKDM
ncbi:sterol regulatory element binding protein, transcription factor sre1 [Gigaspora margarita]|uniref:Sterol regulatory element binding protein, transcription factor sre1 n=1 Tax=Gigaspora margarita TaxID=4874 RepID=A0A8H4AMK9_GIGMA|nr:sterol regulatory element binding protein, transcription factor sre1 [Gigaspora margarita]